MLELEQTIQYLRKRLGLYIEAIDDYVAADDQASFYHVMKRRKSRGGYRQIYHCESVKVRNAHKAVYEMLRGYQGYTHPAANGFIKKKSSYTNALNHTQKKYILHLDIKDFFDSISTANVKNTLLRLGARADVAELLSRLSTVDGILRQGLHTSPDLSNHCFYECDEELSAICKSQNVTYSRYGDDMSFSSNDDIDAAPLISTVESHGFVINQEKTKIQKRGSNQYVTGLTVFDSKPRIPKAMKKKLRQQLYYIEKFGFVDHVIHTRARPETDFDSREEYEHHIAGLCYGSARYLTGHISYVNSVEPEKAKRMWQIANKENLRDYTA